ncbi:hypothetical protein [Lactobacillus taiwanensis]|uniref:hypothetical protein n=1 Tax=Lactobacillus taiwanensis TaxID=508451 RepID=UPI0025A9EF5D|nr:hypothetical protein [Lactobacillus taiwanensis]
MYKTDIVISKWFNKKINEFFKTNLSTRESDIFMFTGIFSALVIFMILFYCVIMPNL